MSQYIVSARKYRPTRFSEVAGQEHISTTLKNAIKNNKLAQSFLFNGPRGVGKTTCARILAKTVNCENRTADYEACDTCPSCVAFRQSQSFNIFELDAASNNSVEDIRSLTEQVRFAPQSGKYKVYIIDEVHMLSATAFNAFLKTLEEPPSYAIFILATTEKNKILPTIISRCQVFDFARIGIQEIMNRLHTICSEENIAADEQALHLIAEKADGGLRDALSLFDRLVSFGDGKLEYEAVLHNLNILDYDYFFCVLEALSRDQLPQAVMILDSILRKGFEGEDFIIGLAQHIRNLLMAKEPQLLPLLESSNHLKNRYAEQAAVLSRAFLLNGLNIANECSLNYKNAQNKRLQIELALWKMAHIGTLLQTAKTIPTALAPANPATTAATAEKKTELPPPPATTAIAPPPPVAAPTAIVSEPMPPPAAPAIATAAPSGYMKKVADKKTENMATVSLNIDVVKEAQPASYRNNRITLTQEHLENHWKDFGNSITSERSRQLWLQCEPLLEKGQIKINVESALRQADLRNEGRNFIEMLREKADIQHLELTVEIVKKEEEENKIPYTPREKFADMANKNPYLQSMVQRWGLELS